MVLVVASKWLLALVAFPLVVMYQLFLVQVKLVQVAVSHYNQVMDNQVVMFLLLLDVQNH